jgi:DNA-binding CsgD family transcriptional regulator
MEAVEFFVIGGQTCIRRNGVSKPLKPSDRDEVEWMLGQMRSLFPAATGRLEEWAAESKANKRYFEYRMVDRFIRCNFGEADFLYSDVENGMFHFEEVKCPLRGICKDENVICKPKFKIPVSKEEGRAAALYSKGLTATEIAKVLGKGVKTVKNQLSNAAKRLGLSKTRDLIKVFSVYNITLWD